MCWSIVCSYKDEKAMYLHIPFFFFLKVLFDREHKQGEGQREREKQTPC